MPHNVPKALGIIPDLPIQEQINHTAYHKFNGCDQVSPTQAFHQEVFTWVPAINQIKEQEANAAGEGHSPMGKPSPKEFNQAVAQGTGEIDGAVFLQFPFFHRLSAFLIETRRLGREGFTLLDCAEMRKI